MTLAERLLAGDRRALARGISLVEDDDPDGWELQNMLTVASLMVEGALAREESRGVHLRTDFPKTDDEHWRRHLAFTRPGAGGF